jgi:hypothetical protein
MVKGIVQQDITGQKIKSINGYHSRMNHKGFFLQNQWGKVLRAVLITGGLKKNNIL